VHGSGDVGVTRATVIYCGVSLDCEYDYTPGESGTYIDPPYPASAEVHSCKVGGVEIVEMLTNSQLEALDTLILESRGEQDQDDASEEYQRQRDERAMEGFLA
jgi:hypothetical protein